MSLSVFELFLLTLAGVAAGWVNVLAGGGSLLTVPIMLFAGLPGPVANGTNRIAIIAQNVVAVFSFFRRGFSDFRLSLSLAACACVGAFFGANVGVQIEGVWFNRLVAAIIVGVMIIMAFDGGSTAAEGTQDGKPKNLVLGHALFVGAGFWGGFIQIAVGFVMMPILHRVMGLDLVRTNMHKVFVALTFSFVALAVFASKVSIAWEAGAALAIGNAVGGWLGANAAVEKGAPFIRKVLFVALAAMAVKLLFF
ncbi:MAG: sulfite exporter TauE/SafE family protein [Pseudomonadota bacterium]